MPTSGGKKHIEYQDRDFAVLRALFDSRFMTLTHIAKLHFKGRREAAKKRIQRLKTAGLISQHVRGGHDSSALFLTPKGLNLLVDRGEISEAADLVSNVINRQPQVSEQTLKHELMIVDVRVALASATTNAHDLMLERFSTNPVEYSFYAKPARGEGPVLVKPDAYMVMKDTAAAGHRNTRRFFLEVDRSTERQELLMRKAACYVHHYRQGGLALRHGCEPAEFKRFPFRVLMVFQSVTRRDLIAKRLLAHDPPILTQVLLATFSDVLRDPFGAIWITPASFRSSAPGAGGPQKKCGPISLLD